MKKAVLLLCGLMLLCLCACQAGEAAPEKRLPPDRELTMEEALEYATPLYSYEFVNEIVEDMDTAKKNCEGYYYLMNLFIATNDPDNDYLRALAEDPNVTTRSGVQYVVYLPEEERANLKTGDIIQVVGRISYIGVSDVLKRSATVVEVNDAHYIKNAFEISGEVLMVETHVDGRRYCKLVDPGLFSSELGEIAVFLPEEFDCAVGDTITATGKLSGCIELVFIARKLSEYWLCMEVPESIKKE